MHTVLVTGSSGFVGSALVEKLDSIGFSVKPTVRRATGLKNEVVIGDIESYKNWQELLAGTDVVIHLAARAHILNDTVEDPLAAFRKVNTQATIQLARECVKAGVKRFIFLSSIGVNGGSSGSQPFQSTDKPNPHSHYAISKLEAEEALRAISSDTGLDVVIIRPPLIYGPGAPGNFRSMMKWMSKSIPLPLGSIENNRRSFVSLDNLCDLVKICIEHPKAANETFLVSDGEDLSTTDLLRRIANAAGKRAMLIPVPARLLRYAATSLGKANISQRLLDDLQIDIAHTVDTLGWTPPYSMNECLQKAVAEYR